MLKDQVGPTPHWTSINSKCRSQVGMTIGLAIDICGSPIDSGSLSLELDLEVVGLAYAGEDHFVAKSTAIQVFLSCFRALTCIGKRLAEYPIRESRGIRLVCVGHFHTE